MTDDEMVKIMNAVTSGIKAGFNHTSPSKMTMEHMRNTDLKLATIDKDIEILQRDISRNTEVNIEVRQELKGFIEAADDKYANKDTEVAIKRVGWMVITAVILALMALILKS